MGPLGISPPASLPCNFPPAHLGHVTCHLPAARCSAHPPTPPPAPSARPDPQDFRASGSLEPFFDLFGVPGIVRKAAFLMRGLRIEVSDSDELRVTMLCALSWFNRVEAFPMDGSPALLSRRDMRRGWQRGSAEARPDGGVELQLWWPQPFEGRASDRMRVHADGSLHVELSAWTGKGRAVTHVVYRRQGGDDGLPRIDRAP